MLKRYYPLIVYAVLAAIIIYLFPTYNASFNYTYKEGLPWRHAMLTSEYEFPILKDADQLEEEQQKALRGLAPCFVLAKGASLDSIQMVSAVDLRWLQQQDIRRISILNNHTSTNYLVEDLQVATNGLVPTLSYDSITNRHLRDNVLTSISTTEGMVHVGQKIIGKGEIVDSHTYQVLESLRMYMRSHETLDQPRLRLIHYSQYLLIIILITLFIGYLFVFRPVLFGEWRAALFFSMLIGVMSISTYTVVRFADLSWIYLLPYAWVPIITCVFYDSRTATTLHMISMLMCGLAIPEPSSFYFTQILVGLIVVLSLRDMTQRAQLAQTSLYILITYAIFYTLFTLASTGGASSLDWHIYLLIIGNAILIIGSYGLIYLVEKIFGLLSNITLVELSNINSDLLHRFADEAPGTFQHSLQVSNLGAEAAKKIGANALLVRAGALYHDMGKLAHPENFTENQIYGNNPLLRMTNREAAAAIIAHVRDGCELAKKHHLPNVLINFIATHHGTSLVRYFYNTEVNQNPDKHVDEADFRYPGPKPSTKEGAILMIADAIEACSRSLQEYTEQSISDMVDQMINAQISDGQLADTPLSFKDVEDIRQVFKNKIMAMNHHRIAYPTIQK